MKDQLHLERPEWVHCIERSHAEHKDESWCGLRIFGFNFVDIDHAAENGKQGGRLVACPECVTAVHEALKNGHEDLAKGEGK